MDCSIVQPFWIHTLGLEGARDTLRDPPAGEVLLKLVLDDDDVGVMRIGELASALWTKNDDGTAVCCCGRY